MKSWLRAHGFTCFLGVACVALGGQVIVLSRQKHALEAAHSSGDPRAQLFQVGEPFFPLELRTHAGEALEVRFGAGEPRTLVLVTADACPVCPEVVPRWEEIAVHFLAEGTRVIGARLGSADDDPSWIQGVPLGSFADLTRVPLSKLRAVPLTVLIDAAGAIEWLHYGTLTDARVAELMAHL